MTRTQMLAAGALFAAALAPATAADAPAAMPVGQIIDRNIAARGGLAAWKAVQTLTLAGMIDAGGKENHQLPFVNRMKRPHKSRLEITFKDQTSIQVFDGTHGWKVRPFLNRNEVEDFTPAELKSAAAAEELDGPLVDYAAKGTKVALVGSDVVEKHPAYKLKLTTRTGQDLNLWIDAKTFLELKIDGEPRRMDGRMHNVHVFYRDFKTEHGLTTPRVLETEVDGVKGTHKMDITRVAINEPMDDSLFQKPQLNATPVPAAKKP